MNVKQRRKELGLSSEAAAERADLHIRHWQKVEYQDVNPTLDTLARIAAALDMTIPALFLPPLTRR